MHGQFAGLTGIGVSSTSNNKRSRKRAALLALAARCLIEGDRLGDLQDRESREKERQNKMPSVPVVAGD